MYAFTAARLTSGTVFFGAACLLPSLFVMLVIATKLTRCCLLSLCVCVCDYVFCCTQVVAALV